MTKEIKQIINMPYEFIIFTTLPIFIIIFSLPEYPTTKNHTHLNFILDNYLLGQTGYWSSNFPFTSKAISNYIGIFGPIFSLITYFKIRKTMVINPNQYNNITTTKYLLMLISMISLIFFILYALYLGNTDLGTHNLKWGFFGRNLIPFALFSSSILFLFHCFPIFIYSIFYFVPRLLVNRWKNK